MCGERTGLGGPLPAPPGFELRLSLAGVSLATLDLDPVYGHKDMTIISGLAAVRHGTC